MKIEINLSELFDVISILGVWADDMSQIAPEEELKTRTIMCEIQSQLNYHIGNNLPESIKEVI